MACIAEKALYFALPVPEASRVTASATACCRASPRYRCAPASTDDPKADMNEEERKARDQQLRSSIHKSLVESGEYDK